MGGRAGRSAQPCGAEAGVTRTGAKVKWERVRGVGPLPPFYQPAYPGLARTGGRLAVWRRVSASRRGWTERGRANDGWDSSSRLRQGSGRVGHRRRGRHSGQVAGDIGTRNGERAREEIFRIAVRLLGPGWSSSRAAFSPKREEAPLRGGASRRERGLRTRARMRAACRCAGRRADRLRKSRHAGGVGP